jgi:diguanylate cyclase (GGDEF)-like protein/PAS domain S-box-containing protein
MRPNASDLPATPGAASASLIDRTPQQRLAQSLQDARALLNTALDGLTAHVCVLDEHGTVLAVNRAWRQFAQDNQGAAPAVLEGSNYLQACRLAGDGLAPEARADAQAFASQLAQVLAGRSTGFQFEYPCHSPTEQRWFLARVMRIDGSEPPRTVVAHDNITALKQTQETLRDSEALLLDLAASIPGAMFRLVQQADGGWRFVYFSPGVEPLFELTPAQVCGDIRILGRYILPEDLAAHDQSIRDAVQAHRIWEHEYRIVTPGKVLKWVHAKASPKPGVGGDTVWTGVLTDVSERKHMEAVLRASEARYRTLFETVPQGVVFQDARGRITSANPAAQRILGLTLAQMQGLTSIDPRWHAVHEDGSDFPGDQHPAMQALRSGQPVQGVRMGVHAPERGLVWLQVTAIPLFHQGVIDEVYASFEDITERVRLDRELQAQATTDFLTGLANRRQLMASLAQEFERCRRQPGTPCTVLALDLDHFKAVNDRWGHAVGDAVLCHVARLMGEETRLTDLVARSGGEEFTLLLPGTGADEALALAHRLRLRLVHNPMAGPEGPITVTASIGVGLMLPTDASADAALARADQALYEAKHAGRNTVRLAPLAA